jgi:hypothetical protein
MFSPTICHAQNNYTIDNCFAYQPNYNDVDPPLSSGVAWVQGSSFNVTVEGPVVTGPSGPGGCVVATLSSWVMLPPSFPPDPDNLKDLRIGPAYTGVILSSLESEGPYKSSFQVSVTGAAPQGIVITLQTPQSNNEDQIAGIWYIQIVPPPSPPSPPPPPACPTPVLTAVTPDIWFAGKTYKTTLTGSGFTKTKDCPAPTVNITDANNNSIPYSKVNVKRDSEMVVTAVAPPASDPTETACVTLGNEAIINVVFKPAAVASAADAAPAPGAPGSACTDSYGNQGITVQILGAPTIQCSGASMQCNGKTISVTDDGSGTPPTAQSAVVGQQILLNTTPADTDLAALGLTFSKNTWTVGPTTGPTNNVGAYTMNATKTTAKTTITQTDLTKTGLTTYWLYPNSNNPVTYQYCVNIPGLTAADVKNGLNCSLPADAAFNSVGPTANIVPTTTAWHVSIPVTSCTTTAKEQMLNFGTINPATSTTCQPVITTSGMTFDATVNLSPGNSGQTEWVQVLGPIDKTTGTGSGGRPIPSTNHVGLDNVLPYNDIPITVDATTTETSDSPGTGLDMTWDVATRIFNAKMYLMWTSQIPGSITVPLGYVQWAISGTATAQDGRTPLWSLSPSGPTSKQFHTGADDGTKSHGLPTFSHLVKNGVNAATDENETEENQEEQQ